MPFRVAALAVIILALDGFLVGWLNPVGQAPPKPLVVTRGQGAPPQLPAAPGDTAWAISELAPHLNQAVGDTGHGGDPDAPPPRPVAAPPPAPPPPPDPVVVFRAELTAVVAAPGGAIAVLNEPGPDGPQVRKVKVGDVVTGRWRLRSLSMNEAELDDGQNQRRIALNGAAGGRE